MRGGLASCKGGHGSTPGSWLRPSEKMELGSGQDGAGGQGAWVYLGK